MKKKYVLAIDQSTQGTKGVLFDQKGELFCRADLTHQQIINEKGWVSHNLNEIYRNVIQVVKNLIEKAGIEKEEIACLGICNQRETAAAWSRITGEPLANAIVWQCSRAEEICERIRKKRSEVSNLENVDEMIHSKTGIKLSPYFPAAKYAWFQENVEAVQNAKRNQSLCLGTIDSWLLFKLSKGEVYATDYSNASRTQLFNINTLSWDEKICSLFGIDVTMLPKVCDSSFEYGKTDFEGYLDCSIPICGVIGDSQGALFGQGCLKNGMVKATYGTGSSVMMNTGEKAIISENGLVTSLAWGMNGKISYVLEGNIHYTGAVISWLKDDVKIITTPSETQEMAQLANQEDETYLVPAFSGLGAPYWKPNAKAIIYRMSRTTGKNEIVRAALESIAYQITDIIELMKVPKEIEVRSLCVDGGPTQNQFLMQFQSDMLGVNVILPRCEESSALGAAFMAGIYYGIYTIEMVKATINKEQYKPSMKADIRKKKYSGWKEAVKILIS